MYVIRAKGRAYVDYEIEVEMNEEDAYDFEAGHLTYKDIESRYEEEIEKAHLEVDLNEWECSHETIGEIEIDEE
jgi:hypothetical protein